MNNIRQYGQLFYQRFVIPVWLMGTLTLSILYLTHRYTIAFPEQETKCLPYSMFIIDTFDKTVVRSKLFSFKNKGWKAGFKDGEWTVIKIAAGVPGDEINVGIESTVVGEDVYGGLEDYVINKLDSKADDYIRQGTVPEDKYFALGTLTRTYDSRYWGYVDKSQIVGRAYAIF